jgi:hypothetical protein
MPAKTKDICTVKQHAVCEQERVKQALYVFRVRLATDRGHLLIIYVHIAFIVENFSIKFTEPESCVG